jgi:hypothetical protein
LRENEPVYYSYENLLTPLQWKLASAFAKEGSVKEPFSGEFLSKYNLKSPSSIQRAMKTLLKQEVIVFYNDSYIIYDVFFSLWLMRNVI